MTATRGKWAPDRVLAELERLALRAQPRNQFFDEATDRLRRAFAFDVSCWHTLDPGSDLVTAHHLMGAEDHFPLLARNEYAEEDVNKFAALARQDRKAATLTEATGGHPERSARFRNFLSRGGLGPELRSAFVADGTAWGSLILARRADQPDFTQRDADLLDRASALLARAVRRGLVMEACESHEEVADAPGVLELDPEGALVRASSSAQPLLDELSGGGVDAGVRAPAVHAIAAATRTAIARAGGMTTPTLPSAPVRT
ncbi:MAG TPA: hypothetical protein VGH93_03405, partial [Solirubrobacteraceae bacterium]